MSYDFSFEESDTDRGGIKSPFSPDLHLKTAIRKYDREMLIDRLVDEKSPSPLFIRQSAVTLNKNPIFRNKPIIIDSEKYYHILLNPILKRKDNMKKFTRKFKENSSVAQEICVVAARLLLEEVTNKDIVSTLQRNIRNLKLPESLTPWLIYRNFWEIIRDDMKNLQIKSIFDWKHVNQKTCLYDYFINGNFLIIIIENEMIVFDYMQVMMIVDTVNTRYLSLLFLELSGQLNLDQNPTVNELLEIYSWGDNVLRIYGNESFNILKNFEAICTGVFLEKYEFLEMSKSFCDKVIDSQENEGYAIQLRKLKNALYNTRCTPSVIFEIFGCYRHFGHPTVDEIAGIESLRENSNANIPIDDIMCKKVSGAFNRMFVIQFIKQHRRWPKCTVDESSENENLIKLVSNQPLVISEYEASLSLLDWHDVIFQQEISFDDFPDFTILLSDKSLSPFRENWFSIYNQDVLNVTKPRNVKESRRVLLEILRRPDFSCKDVRLSIQNDNIPIKWLVVALHSKERELKIKARLFAMMCLEMRIYFNMTEKNLATGIFPYIPYQTMTWTESELQKVLLEMTNNTSCDAAQDGSESSSKKNKNINIIISLDFNKFNQKWRYESTFYIFQTFDRLFGTPGLYTFSHLFFQNSFFYLSSTYKPPDIWKATSDEDYRSRRHPQDIYPITEVTWKGQLGGCEGLRQKGWTAIISSALAANEYETGIHSMIIGQGDNQVIVASFPMKDESLTQIEYLTMYPMDIQSQLKIYLANLTRLTNGIGMDLKLEESWTSFWHLNYGKEIIINGSFLSSSTKKIGRAYQEISELYPTIQNRIASIATSSQATALKGYDIVIPYYISIIESLSLLDKESIYGTVTYSLIKELLSKTNLQLDYNLKMFFAIFPKECGGLPIQSFINYLFRGHPDPISADLLWLKELQDNIPIASLILDFITSGLLLDDSRQDYLMLIQDPHSVNFKKSVQSSNLIKHMLLSALNNETKNKHLKKMLTSYTPASLEKMSNYLMTFKPCAPRVLNEMLRLSPDGSMLSFISTFTDMRTMKGMISSEDAHNLMEMLQKGDVEMIENLLKIYKIVINKRFYSHLPRDVISYGIRKWMTEKQTCISSLVQELRDIGWGISIEGVTAPHPEEQMSIHLAQGENCTRGEMCEEMIIYVLTNPNRVKYLQDQDILKRGSQIHYLGSGTSEKRSGPIIQFTKHERSIKAAQQLMRIKHWLIDDIGSGKIFLDKLIESRTSLNEDFLVLTAGVNYGGSPHHRFSDVTTKHEGRPSIRVNTHSMIHITSDQLGKYARGSDNYPMMFQGIYLTAMNKISHAVLHFPEVMRERPIAYHHHVRCLKCLPLLTELPLLATKKPPNIKILRDCPLIYADIDTIADYLPYCKIDNTSLIIPDSNDKKLEEKICSATSAVLLGETYSIATPTVQSKIATGYKEGTLVCLTVGLFSKISFGKLFKELSSLWFYDQFPVLIKKCIKTDLPLMSCVIMVLQNYPDYAWDLLKPFLCLEEKRDEVLSIFHDCVTSTETFVTGKGLGYAVNRVIERELRAYGTFNNIPIPSLLTTSPSISLNRCVAIWINILVAKSGLIDLFKMDDLLRILRGIAREQSPSDGIDMTKIYLFFLHVDYEGVNMKKLMRRYPFQISKIGAEPWLIAKLMSKPSSSYIPEITQYESNLLDIIRLRELIMTIPYHQEINIMSQGHDIEGIFESEATKNESRIEIKTRSDHMYRLNGKFSTAYLKYLFILIKEGVTQVSGAVCMAEGAGSVARMLIYVFGAKIIIYNSLFPTTGSYSHRSYNYLPAELQSVSSRCVITGPKICYTTGGDISNKNVQSLYSDLVNKNSRFITVATCDAESPTTFKRERSLALMIGFLNSVSKIKGGTFCIFKTFCIDTQILVRQISIWIQKMERTKLIVPKTSSNESTEIFLIGWSKFQHKSKNNIDVKNNYLSHDEIYRISSILESRRQSLPLLHDISNSILKELSSIYTRLGFPNNFANAVHIFLGYRISESEIESDIFHSLATCSEICYNMILSRYDAISKLRSMQELPVHQRLRIIKDRKDSHEFNDLAENMFNSYILRYILIHREIPQDFWTIDHFIEYKQELMYTYTPDINLWILKYGRCFFKILGFLRIIKNYPIFIPLSIRSNINNNN
ncbi:RNA-dependent RNA polymerase [Hemipteran arli-related virus OKIAV95]|uniref:RNA-directed RNA polymerase L n=1 Tax=Hemipteran arli-related virus OKIAV95 TaxID=2792567 RepID=A0AAE7TPV6_9MONO|nr:RNA-dependent RNA polymerase [Hemipteran arli-related virus OKIAV95]QPL15300.1 RNA-dependent RNA polymerase [Hemipteran arli-related virus OKIAV95]